MERRLAAIVCADVAGYSRMMGVDEAGTHAAFKAHRSAIHPMILNHGGRIKKDTRAALLPGGNNRPIFRAAGGVCAAFGQHRQPLTGTTAACHFAAPGTSDSQSANSW